MWRDAATPLLFSGDVAGEAVLHGPDGVPRRTCRDLERARADRFPSGSGESAKGRQRRRRHSIRSRRSPPVAPPRRSGRGGDDPDLATYVATVGAESRVTARVVHVVEHAFPSGFAIETVGEAKNLVQEAAFMLQMAGIGAEGIVRHGRLDRIGIVLLEEAANWHADAIVLRARRAIGWQRPVRTGRPRAGAQAIEDDDSARLVPDPAGATRSSKREPSAWPTPVGG